MRHSGEMHRARPDVRVIHTSGHNEERITQCYVG
jgi:hypothetical protein